ncbi:MAG: CRISPR-associated endoribonuclease Cas6, partial [Armatimonadota bacterium]|nr:CRISPR-associated endoribonuclease Cas6 [Armatimonadota bacterium]MDW8144595.1 CRISPR-associated endoribonuclease Cas6 [Armatimonadota bacterium]
PVGEWKSRLYEVQGTKVRGFEGRFWAEGNPELLKIGYDAGFGERNAQGFGMVKLVRRQEA